MDCCGSCVALRLCCTNCGPSAAMLSRNSISDNTGSVSKAGFPGTLHTTCFALCVRVLMEALATFTPRTSSGRNIHALAHTCSNKRQLLVEDQNCTSRACSGVVTKLLVLLSRVKSDSGWLTARLLWRRLCARVPWASQVCLPEKSCQWRVWFRMWQRQ